MSHRILTAIDRLSGNQGHHVTKNRLIGGKFFFYILDNLQALSHVPVYITVENQQKRREKMDLVKREY